MTIRDIAIAMGYEIDQQSYNNAMRSINSFASTAKKILGTIAVGAILNQAKAQVEAYMKVNNQLAYAVDYMEDQAALQDRIMKAAQEGGTSYASMGNAVKQMIQDTNMWTLSLEEATDLASTMSKVFRGAGLSREESGSLVSQFAANFSNGRLTNLSSMLQEAPELVNYLAKSLNMTAAGVKALAANGGISLKQFTKAISENLDDIEKRYGKIQLTITESLSYVKDKFFYWLSKDGQSIVNNIAQSIKKIGDNLEPTLNKLKSIIDKLGGLKSVLGGLLGIFGASKIFSGGVDLLSKLKSIFPALGAGAAAGEAGAAGSALSKILPVLGKMSWIIALIYIALKAIVDIFKFVTGQESETEKAYRGRGINAVEARADLVEAINTIKESVGALFEAVSAVWSTLKSAFGSAFHTVLMTLTNTLKSITPAISSILTLVADLLQLWNAVEGPKLEMVVKILGRIVEWITWLVNAFFKKIYDGVYIIVNAFTKLLKWFGVIKEDVGKIAGEVVDNNVENVLNTGNNKTITISVNNDFTFNGADRQNQVNAAKSLEQSSDDIFEKLKVSVAYGG